MLSLTEVLGTGLINTTNIVNWADFLRSPLSQIMEVCCQENFSTVEIFQNSQTPSRFILKGLQRQQPTLKLELDFKSHLNFHDYKQCNNTE